MIKLTNVGLDIIYVDRIAEVGLKWSKRSKILNVINLIFNYHSSNKYFRFKLGKKL